MLPQIEEYLRQFPGVTAITRDRAAAEPVLYRLTGDGTAADAAARTRKSLRKMLHHLQLEARITRDEDLFLIEGGPAAAGTAARNW